jgi:hypothetical protein
MHWPDASHATVCGSAGKQDVVRSHDAQRPVLSRSSGNGIGGALAWQAKVAIVVI